MANTLRFKRGLVATIPTAVAGEPLFTTDTFDLYIGNGTNNTRFQKYIASGTTSQLLRGDGSLLTMPIVLTSPSNGQVLKYNGTNWVNDSDAGVTGSGTTNYLPKWTSGSALGNSNLEDIGGNIVKLGNTSISNAALITFQNSVNGFQFGFNSTTTQRFVWNNGAPTEIMCLTGTGNLGLGVVPSAWSSLWSAQQFGQAGSLFAYKSGSNYTVLTNNSYVVGGAYQTGDARYLNNGLSTAYIQNNSGEHLWMSAPSGTAGNTISFTQAMTLNASGQLGIGTTSPAYKLDVVGTINTSGQILQTLGDNQILYSNTSATTGYQYMRMVSSGASLIWGIDANPSAALFTGSLANSANIGNGKNAPFHIATNAIVRATIDASGNLGLAVVPSAWNNTTKALQINGGSIYAANTFTFVGSNSVYTNSGDQYINTGFATVYGQLSGEHRWYTAPSGTAGNAITFTQAMTLTAGGNLLVGTTTDAGFKLDVNGTGRFYGANQDAIQTVFTLGGKNASAQAKELYFRLTAGGTPAWTLQTASIGTNTNVNIFPDGTNGLTIAYSTGAATFASSVTTSSDIYQLYLGAIKSATYLDASRYTIQTVAGYHIAFEPATVERMRLTAAGRLLLGTTTESSFLLDVNGTARVSSTITLNGSIITSTNPLRLNSYIVGSASGFFINNNADTDNNFIVSDNGNTRVYRGSLTIGSVVGTGTGALFAGAATFSSSVTAGGSIASGLGLIVANATNARRFELGYSTGAGYNFFQVYDGAAFQPMMINNLLYLNGSSNVGIGTTSPAAKLHLVDSVESEIRTQYSTTSSGKLITGNGFTTIGSITNDPLVFVSNNTERMRFTNGGNLLLGSTSDTGEKFQVTGAGIVSGLFTVSGSTGIPATTAANLRFASGFSSPDIGRMYIGDGSGWKFHMSKRLSSTTTDLITFFDNGSVQTSAPTGYAAKPYKLGEVLTNAATADRSVAVEIDGTVYFLLASTTAP